MVRAPECGSGDHGSTPCYGSTGVYFNGRMAGSKPVDQGSIPCTPAISLALIGKKLSVPFDTSFIVLDVVTTGSFADIQMQWWQSG